MSKMNCWEFKKCGREPGGEKVDEFGVCPAAVSNEVDGIHDGKNGGRCCWVISGTFCGGKPQGIYAMKLANCVKCEFYKKVVEESSSNRVDSMEILNKLKNKN